MYDFTNVDPVKCCTWLVLPTVYDESLSYGEQLNKFCKALNELIENNNNLPDYVAEMIQNYITSGAIDEVVRNILANYILNVKYPPKGITPAVGDGSADDTVAIQGCIDYAFNQGGGCVYLPYGKYLSRSLTLRSGVSLVGFDRYSTRIVQRGGDTKPLVSGGNVQNVQISNLTLDGNNEVQTDDLDVVNVLGKDCLFTNLVIKSGFQCFVYNGLGGDLQVDNVVFYGAVKKVAVINGKDSVQFSNVKFNELGKVQGECVIEVSASDGVYSFSSKAVTPVCIKCVGNRNSFIADIINSTINFVDTGSMNNFNVLGVEVKEQLAQDKNSSVDGNATENITGNKTETVGAGKVENITGSKTETVGSGKDENITGSKTEVISENKSENITGNREIVINGTDSIHIDGVSTLIAGGARTEIYGNSRNVGITGVNTEEYHDTMSEKFDKKHIVTGTDETNTFTGNNVNSANKFSFTSNEKSFTIDFPDKAIDIYKLSENNYINGHDYGVTEESEDISDALNELILTYGGKKTIIIFGGNYKANKTINIHNYNTTLLFFGRLTSTANCIINVLSGNHTLYFDSIIGNDKNIGFQYGSDNMRESVGNSNITINALNHLNVGILLTASNSYGVQHNIFHLNRIDHFKNGIILETTSGASWVNENNFYDFWCFGYEGNSGSEIGILTRKNNQQTDPFNGNRFINFSCEGCATIAKLEFAKRNTFENFRSIEQSGTKQIICLNDCEFNYFSSVDSNLDYDSIKDSGFNNLYKINFYKNEFICTLGTFAFDTFIPCDTGIIYSTTNYSVKNENLTIDKSSGLKFLTIINNTSEPITIVLPICASYAPFHMNQFIIETGIVSGGVNIIMFGGQKFMNTIDDKTLSGYKMKDYKRYIVTIVDNLTYRVIEL